MYILNDLALASRGYYTPGAGGYCPLPLTIATQGIVVLPFAAAGGMADPRIREPFDRGYYLWKYGKPQQRQQREAPAAPKKPPSNLAEILAERESEAALLALEGENREIQRDIAQLEAYIQAIREAMDEDRLRARQQMLADRQALAAEQKALIAQLEENMAAARDSLLIALERKRILANQQAAILAVIETFY